MSKITQIKATQAKPTVKIAELIVKEEELSYEQIFQFVKQHAGGNEGNVNIVPLPNVDILKNLFHLDMVAKKTV
jgi:hypothetical protein